MPIKDILCRDCGHVWEELIRGYGDTPVACVHCESDKLEVLPSAHGGYHIRGANGASVRPRSSGSFKKAKS